MPYLTQEQLKAISEHKYSGTDDSLLSYYVLQPFWEKATLLFPTWMAPNVITLLGCLFPLAAHCIMMFYCPSVACIAPNWVYALCAVCVFLFQTLDAVDGKQARRTKFLFPLGDLFDHGSDILTFSVGVVTLSSMLQLDAFTTLFLVLWGSMLPSYAYHWEMRYTRSLALGIINGPVEGLLLGVLQFALGAYYGPQLWTRTLPELTGVAALPAVSLATLSAGSIALLTFTSLGPNVITVYKQLGLRKVTGMARLVTMLRDMSQVLLLMLAVVLVVAADPASFARTPLPVLYIAILSVSDAQDRHLVARLSRTQPPAVSPLTALLLLLAVLLALPARVGIALPLPLSYVQLTGAAAAVCAVVYVRYARAVIGEITAYLGIYCFSMQRRTPATRAA